MFISIFTPNSLFTQFSHSNIVTLYEAFERNITHTLTLFFYQNNIKNMNVFIFILYLHVWPYAVYIYLRSLKGHRNISHLGKDPLKKRKNQRSLRLGYEHGIRSWRDRQINYLSQASWFFLPYNPEYFRGTFEGLHVNRW